MQPFSLFAFLLILGIQEAGFIVIRLMAAQLSHDFASIDSMPSDVKINTFKHIIKPALFGAPISAVTAFVAVVMGSPWNFPLAVLTFIFTFIVVMNVWVRVADRRVKHKPRR